MIEIRPRLLIDPENILWIAGSYNYSVIHYLNGETEMVSVTLKSFEDKFDSRKFYRTYKNSLINIEHIESLDISTKEVRMRQHRISLSRRRLNDFVENVKWVGGVRMALF